MAVAVHSACILFAVVSWKVHARRLEEKSKRQSVLTGLNEISDRSPARYDDSHRRQSHLRTLLFHLHSIGEPNRPIDYSRGSASPSRVVRTKGPQMAHEGFWDAAGEGILEQVDDHWLMRPHLWYEHSGNGKPFQGFVPWSQAVRWGLIPKRASMSWFKNITELWPIALHEGEMSIFDGINCVAQRAMDNQMAKKLQKEQGVALGDFGFFDDVSAEETDESTPAHFRAWYEIMDEYRETGQFPEGYRCTGRPQGFKYFSENHPEPGYRFDTTGEWNEIWIYDEKYDGNPDYGIYMKVIQLEMDRETRMAGGWWESGFKDLDDEWIETEFSEVQYLLPETEWHDRQFQTFWDLLNGGHEELKRKYGLFTPDVEDATVFDEFMAKNHPYFRYIQESNMEKWRISPAFKRTTGEAIEDLASLDWTKFNMCKDVIKLSCVEPDYVIGLDDFRVKEILPSDPDLFDSAKPDGSNVGTENPVERSGQAMLARSRKKMLRHGEETLGEDDDDEFEEPDDIMEDDEFFMTQDDTGFPGENELTGDDDDVATRKLVEPDDDDDDDDGGMQQDDIEFPSEEEFPGDYDEKMDQLSEEFAHLVNNDDDDDDDESGSSKAESVKVAANSKQNQPDSQQGQRRMDFHKDDAEDGSTVDFEMKTKNWLKALCREKGLLISGSKDALIDRLNKYYGK